MSDSPSLVEVAPSLSGGRKAVVVGATGATGRQVIKELLANDQWTEVLTVVRRPGAGVYYDGELPAKLKEVVVRNFAEDLRSTLQAWKGRDALFNCLGTTRATAGGAKGFKDVEVGCTEAAAKVAKEAGVPHVLVVSAMGANANAWVDPWEMVHPLLYARTLGQKEKAVLDQDFPQVTIFRPGALNRLSTDRVIEKVWTAFNIGLRVDTLAKAMVREAEVGPTEGRKAPQYIVGNSAISKVAESDSHRMC